MQLGETIYGLILAAGLSTRMGEFKPLLSLRGKTLIENSVESVLQGGAAQVVVVTGYRGRELERLLKRAYGSQVRTVRNYDYAATDMLHSIKIGCASLGRCHGFFLLPGDMPVVRQNTFHRLLSARDGSLQIIFPTLDGYRKHPPLVDARLIPEILAFRGDGGLRQFWQKHASLICTVPVEDEGVWVDLDTQEDYIHCKQQYEIR